jgi:hypothetical protein
MSDAGDVLTADDLRRRRDLRARVAEMPPLIDAGFDDDDLESFLEFSSQSISEFDQ